ncbi:MAG: hypothetical protein M1380_07595 [Chloroflexi bacterium]|nr:hypothetical protein [Chloroflexota bacterium]
MAGEMSETTRPGHTVTLRCSCGSTFAQLREDGAVIIVSRHHGQKCVNVITLEDLMKLQKEARLNSNR